MMRVWWIHYPLKALRQYSRGQGGAVWGEDREPRITRKQLNGPMMVRYDHWSNIIGPKGPKVGQTMGCSYPTRAEMTRNGPNGPNSGRNGRKQESRTPNGLGTCHSGYRWRLERGCGCGYRAVTAWARAPAARLKARAAASIRKRVAAASVWVAARHCRLSVSAAPCAACCRPRRPAHCNCRAMAAAASVNCKRPKAWEDHGRDGRGQVCGGGKDGGADRGDRVGRGRKHPHP